MYNICRLWWPLINVGGVSVVAFEYRSYTRSGHPYGWLVCTTPDSLRAILVSFVHKWAVFNVCWLLASDLGSALVVAAAMCNV